VCPLTEFCPRVDLSGISGVVLADRTSKYQWRGVSSGVGTVTGRGYGVSRHHHKNNKPRTSSAIMILITVTPEVLLLLAFAIEVVCMEGPLVVLVVLETPREITSKRKVALLVMLV